MFFDLDSAVYPHSLNEIYPSVVADVPAIVNTAVVVDPSVVVRSVALFRSAVSVGVKQQYPILDICECYDLGDASCVLTVRQTQQLASTKLSKRCRRL